MNTIEPTLYTYDSTLLAVGLIVGILLLILAFFVMFTIENPFVFFVLVVIGAFFTVMNFYNLFQNGDIDQEATYDEIAEHYDVILPPQSTRSSASNVVRFKIEKDAKQFISLDVLDEKTQEVYDDARIVWDGKEISLLVKAEGSEEYVPLRK